MTALHQKPGADEVEFTLLGPGYGESAVVHLGAGAWMIVDSFVVSESGHGVPAALRYLPESSYGQSGLR